jgi:hypothetical protein
LRKSVRVYSHDANPAIDPPSFAITRVESERRLSSGYVRFLSDKAVQLNPPPGWTPDQIPMMVSGLFDQAWRRKFSANYLVWQMRSQESEP